MNRNLPNILTTLRMLVIPVFLYYLYLSRVPGQILICLVIFVLASLTDYLDGALARKYNVISNYGKIMDPLADKLLVLAALSGITWLMPYRLPVLIFILIFARELIITILREIYKQRGIIVAADKLGKLKTVMQMLGLIAAYSVWAFSSPSPIFVTVITLWFWLVTGITLYSGVNYLRIKA